MSAKHTPGPWIAACNNTAVDGPDQSLICNVTAYKKPTPRQEANARLIAAAPDLLAFVAEYLEAWKDGMAGDSYLRRLAEQAHAKATGGAA